MKRSILLVMILSAVMLRSEDLTKYVDPFIGTGGHGHTYPGASMPFGMVQLSPDTRLTGWDGCSAYHFSDSVIYGFSHTHLSGTGCSDYGDILLMPNNGKAETINNVYSSKFSHQNEKAEAGYYSVLLDKSEIFVELTCSKRSGFHKYTYKSEKNKNILLDLNHRDEVIEAGIEVINDTLMQGYRRSKAWAQDQIIFFSIRFSSPIKLLQFFGNDVLLPEKRSAKGKNLKLFIQFDDNAPNVISAKIGISAVSADNALLNLDAEIPGWVFEYVKKQAKDEWNKELSKIEVEGGTKKQKTIFYTSLYHCLLNPNLYSDIDGRYRGRNNKVYKADGFDYYTVFSLWDTYRAEHPLLALIDTKRSNDFINTFLRQYREGKLLPVWELSSNETYCMIGYHAVPVIADAMLKGIDKYDMDLALGASVKSAEMDHFGLASYKKNHCVLSDDEGESVSKTLEYAYDDWCIAQMAKYLKKDSLYSIFNKRAQYYKNLLDPETGFMRARTNGGWYQPFDPTEVNNHYTEANCWQYSFYVPQDISGFMKLLGGKMKMEEKLDGLFSAPSKMTGREQSDITGIIGQYAHGNEPSHHIAYLYNYCGTPWKTQEICAKIINTLYSDSTDGLCGNEDCGQMSAWYVFSAMGFYPVCPGSNEYAVGTPVFDKVSIRQENGKKFIIQAKRKTSDEIYIQSAKLNREKYNKSFITHNDIMNGGEVSFIMSSKPNKSWAVGESSLPKTEIEDNSYLPLPVIESPGRSFRSSIKVSVKTVPEAQVFYSFKSANGNEWMPYLSPIEINESCELSVKAVKGKTESPIAKAKFFKLPYELSIEIKSKVNRQYTASGPEALIDGIRGKENFRIGDWQGYVGTDFEAILNLGEEKVISSVSAGFLQDVRSWILMPVHVEVSVSNDGIHFDYAGKISNTVPDSVDTPVIKDFVLDLKQTKCKYLKLQAKNYGILPDWHAGAGGQAFIFIDEISVR